MKYKKQWQIASSDPSKKPYTVSLTENGEYKCSCPHWIFRLQKTGKACRHIQEVLDGGGEEQVERHYTFTPSTAREVVQVDETHFMVPLIAFNGYTTDFVATILFDLHTKFGVPWKVIKEHYERFIHKSWTRDAVLDHVYTKGRCVYTVNHLEEGVPLYEYNRVWEVVSGTGDTNEQGRQGESEEIAEGQDPLAD